MAQHDGTIDDANGATVLADLNAAVAAARSTNSGTTAPPSPVAHMPWADTTNGVVWRRNAANSAWVLDGTLSTQLISVRTSNTILALTDYSTTIVATGTFTQTLTAAATLTQDWWITYTNTGAGIITLDPNGSELIGGYATLKLLPGMCVRIQSTGSAFRVLEWAGEFADVTRFGADGSGSASSTAAFTAAGSVRANFEAHIPAGIYNLATTPTPSHAGVYVAHNGVSFTGAAYLPTNCGYIKFGDVTDPWVTPLWSSIYEYMGENAAFNVRARAGGLGIHSAVRSSTGSGSPGEANICYSAFGYADYVGGGEGTWGYYATLLRAPGNTGAIHGMEIDVGNLGSNVELYPSAMFPAGNNQPLWLCSGGESAFASPAATLNHASCAAGIISNDPALNARFLKGIVFHNKALAGVEGDGVGRGPALALSPGHSFTYFNNSTQVAGEYSCTNTDINKGLFMDLSEFGLLVWRRQAGKQAFQAGGTANGVNYFNMSNSVTGAPVEIQALGDDSHIDIYAVPKGTNGRFRIATASSATADVACTRLIEIKESSGAILKLMAIT
jgi:hypothetical protein